MTEGCKDHPRGPEPSTVRLAPRGFSVGVVDSLGGGFVLHLQLALFIVKHEPFTLVVGLFQVLNSMGFNAGPREALNGA